MARRAKAPKGTGSIGVGTVISVISFLLLAAHALTIAEDVKAVIEDPNEENKPAEVLKLAFDVTRYFPK
jgi:hypothetical protein